MKRHIVLATSGAAIAVAALAGCSSDNTESSATTASSATTESSSSQTSSTSSSGAGTSTVIIDNQPQQIAGSVSCTTVGGNVEIVFGDQSGQGLNVSLTTADPPVVNRVAFGSLGGGNLAYQAGLLGGNAEAEVDDKTYNIKGNATNVSLGGIQTKPFEIEVTCP